MEDLVRFERSESEDARWRSNDAPRAGRVGALDDSDESGTDLSEVGQYDGEAHLYEGEVESTCNLAVGGYRHCPRPVGTFFSRLSPHLHRQCQNQRVGDQCRGLPARRSRPRTLWHRQLLVRQPGPLGPRLGPSVRRAPPLDVGVFGLDVASLNRFDFQFNMRPPPGRRGSFAPPPPSPLRVASLSTARRDARLMMTG